MPTTPSSFGERSAMPLARRGTQKQRGGGEGLEEKAHKKALKRGSSKRREAPSRLRLRLRLLRCPQKDEDATNAQRAPLREAQRVLWQLRVRVGSQSISPLYWALRQKGTLRRALSDVGVFGGVPL